MRHQMHDNKAAIPGIAWLDISWRVENKQSIFSFHLGDGPKFLDASARELGLPENFEQARGWKEIPQRSWLIDKVSWPLRERFRDYTEVWLGFRQSDGYLGMMPWEILFDSAQMLPVRRIPYFPTQPPRPPRIIAIAVPSVELFSQAFPDRSLVWGTSPGLVHFFLGSEAASTAHKWKNEFPFARFHVRPVDKSPQREFLHPLLRWMNAVAGDAPFDRVVLFGAATIMQYQAFLYPEPSLGEPPTRSPLAAEELARFLISVGADDLRMYDPEESAAGLFAGLLYRERLRRLFAGLRDGWDRWSASIYSLQPKFDGMLRSLTCKATIDQMLDDGRHPPRSLLAAQRHMEIYVARLLELERQHNRLGQTDREAARLFEDAAQGIRAGLAEIRNIFDGTFRFEPVGAPAH